MKTLKNTRFILSHVYRAVPLYTAGIMVYNVVRAFMTAGDLWIGRMVVSRLGACRGEDAAGFIAVAAFYGIYLVLEYLGNQVNLLLMNWYGSVRSIDISKHMRSLLYHKLEEVDLSCYETNEFYNELGRAVDEIDTRPLQVVNSLADGLYCFLTIVLVLAIVPDPLLLLAGILVVVRHLMHVKKVNICNFEMAREAQPYGRRAEYIRELFKNREFIKEARCFQAEDFFITCGEESMREDYAVSKRYSAKGAASSFFMMLFANLVTFAVSVYLCLRMLRGEYLPGDFVYLVGAFAGYTNMGGLFRIFSEMRDHSMYIDVIRKVLDYRPAKGRLTDSLEKGEMIPGTSLEMLTVENVSFRYGEGGTAALENMNICFKKGEKVALVGENGSGKSTLIKILLDFYPIQEGEILYNGLPYSRLDSEWIRGNFGAMFQDSPIYAFSVAENVLMREAESGRDEQLVIDALTFSGLWEKVGALEKGIYTMVTKEFEEEGIYFSGGEYQKLMIARAFAHQGKVLIFDEPAASLDPAAEYELFHKMMQLGEDKTVIYITHRLGAAIGADRIYYMERGRVEEQGTHQELMELQGRYYRMFSVQMKGYR